MEVTKQFLIAKNSIPPSCFEVGGMVRAYVSLSGVEHIDMTITAIADAGPTNPNADLVTFTFDDSGLPIAGADLDPCFIISFCCLVGCCAPWCEEVFGPGESLVVGTRHVGFLDHPMVASYVFVSVPELSDSGTIQFQVLVNGVALFSSVATVVGHVARIHRSSFSSTFADGQLPADARIDVVIVDTGAIAGGAYYGYGTPAQGLRLCIDGYSY